MSNSLDPDQDLFSVSPDLSSNCLQRVSANDTRRQRVKTGDFLTLVIHFLESIISRLATSEISFFELVPVAEENCLSLVLSETPKTGLARPIKHVCSDIRIKKRQKLNTLCKRNMH